MAKLKKIDLKKMSKSLQTRDKIPWEEIEAIMYGDPHLKQLLDEEKFSRNLDGITNDRDANIGLFGFSSTSTTIFDVVDLYGYIDNETGEDYTLIAIGEIDSDSNLGPSDPKLYLEKGNWESFASSSCIHGVNIYDNINTLKDFQEEMTVRKDGL